MGGREVALATLVAMALAGCGGSGGGNGGGMASIVLYPGAPSLVDGQVGDSPFTDVGGSGLADGRNLTGGTPVTVAWNPPAAQVDGDAIGPLAGYRIYIGHKAGNYDHVIEIGDPAARSYRLAGLAAGTYYFAVSAVDAAGHEGLLSAAAAITVN